MKIVMPSCLCFCIFHGEDTQQQMDRFCQLCKNSKQRDGVTQLLQFWGVPELTDLPVAYTFDGWFMWREAGLLTRLPAEWDFLTWLVGGRRASREFHVTNVPTRYCSHTI